MTKVWAHLHLTRWRSYQAGRGADAVISVKTPGKPIAYLHELRLTDCTFFVSERGRQRTLRTNQRNVHAWVIGNIDNSDAWQMDGWKRAVYDPFKGGTFVNQKTLRPVLYAKNVYMHGKDVFYRD